MLACSLAHEGKTSFSLSRIQVIQDLFMPFPHDLSVEQCEQCVVPACVEVCRHGAIHFTREVPVQEGNVGCKMQRVD